MRTFAGWRRAKFCDERSFNARRPQKLALRQPRSTLFDRGLLSHGNQKNPWRKFQRGVRPKEGPTVSKALTVATGLALPTSYIINARTRMVYTKKRRVPTPGTLMHYLPGEGVAARIERGRISSEGGGSNPSPVPRRLEKAPSRDTLPPRERAGNLRDQ